MKIDIINPHVMKIVIAARPTDSISAISRRIGLSYGWTYAWVIELEKAGVFRRQAKKLFLNEKSVFYKKTLSFIKKLFSSDIAFHYTVLELFGIKYCFTGTDAVFVWTDAGYNISRSANYYPIFIKVNKQDRKNLQYYMDKLGLKGKIFYKPVFLDSFSVDFHETVPVDSLEQTIKFMKKYIYNFQPALEMVHEKYGAKTGVLYKETATNA